MADATGFFDDEEALIISEMREAWLFAEKARLIEYRAQLLSASGAARAGQSQEVDGRVADPIQAAGVGSFGVENHGSDHDFQRFDPRRSVLQSLNLFMSHLLPFFGLQMPKPKLVVDSTQAKPEKGAV